MAIFSSCLPGIWLGRVALLLTCFRFLISSFSSSSSPSSSFFNLAIFRAAWVVFSAIGRARNLRVSWEHDLKTAEINSALFANRESHKYHAVHVKQFISTFTIALMHTPTSFWSPFSFMLSRKMLLLSGTLNGLCRLSLLFMSAKKFNKNKKTADHFLWLCCSVFQSWHFENY